MSPHDRKKLERVARALEESLAVVRDLLQPSEHIQERESASDFDAAAELIVLRALDRGSAETRLAAMKQHQLGALFVEAGGPAADRKKPKVWLVDQLLWRVFDFERGHEAIRGKGQT
jgi:hypothetical protein